MSQDPGQELSNSGMNFTAVRHDTYVYIDPTKFDLRGKNVLITGASKGVGKATAISFAKAGASNIALAARSPLEAITNEVKEAAESSKRAEPNVIALKLDVTDRANVEAVAKELSESFDGRLDILINNAGYLSAFEGILESDPDDWWRHWEVNVKGVYLVTRSFLPLLFKSSLKIIINLTSIGAVWLSPNSSAYGSTKLAIMRFTEYINQDNGKGKDDIIAIAVHPGGVKTELATNMPEAYHSYLIDTPELAGDTLVWLSAERREWLGGRYVTAAWDMETLSGRKEDIIKGDLLKDRMAVNLFPSY
ncbi:oxidoreductase-like protein [Ophiobolus disseminans]|uniref:Oxidoreductase-like protein n=1 Tax=Ophiobolus disseminans TaxID=1469910 RepID=A0A6A7A5L0_9PLEO|nr:oxidoreductase-like protein [Ophiobolus disseminans]